MIDDGYMGNAHLKRAGTEIEFTQEQLIEIAKCVNDPVYFIKNYVKIVNVDRGLVPFEMWPFQEMMVETFHEERFSICKMPRQCGKALSIDTPILTTEGFKPLSEIKVGDKIYGQDGKETNVTFITETMYDRPCYDVKFSNGDVITADGEHLWCVNTQNWRTGKKILTTEQMLPYIDKSNRLYIDFTQTLDFTEQELPIDPYLLGVWLGDGSSSDGRITCHIDDKIFYENQFKIDNTYIDKRNSNVTLNTVYGLFKQLKDNSLLNNKHIPKNYLMSSKEQRLCLLQGLMDTDGSIKKHSGSCEFYQKDEKFIDDFRTLLSSLGIKSTKNSKIIKDVEYFCVRFTTELQVFRLPRKMSLQKCYGHNKNKRLYIQSITKRESVPVRCLQVDNEDHLFLAGTTLIPTHNTTTAAGYMLWAVLFQENYSIAILANKGILAQDILSRIQYAYEYLPIWLQQGIITWNKRSLELENGSKIAAYATSASGVRGGSYNLIFLDEFAFVPQNMANEFFTSTYPVISSGKTTKVIIVSTPYGMNHFYKMWVDAEERRSDYKPVEVHWSMVPGRDEAWKQQTIRNTSEQQFQQEFESCDYTTLINTDMMQVSIGELYEQLKSEQDQN